MKKSVLLLVMVGLLVVPRLGAQVLWHGAAYGMSITEVKKAVPGVVPSVNSSGNKTKDGDEELLHLDGVEIVDQEFTAGFYFKEGKLSQVHLSTPEGVSSAKASVVFDMLIPALRAKYGPEIGRAPSEAIHTVEWVAGRTNVSLIGLFSREFPSIPGKVLVFYQVRIAKESDKL